MDTKTAKVLKHLQTRKRGITSFDAFMKYNATRLSSIIFNLRKKGYPITTIREKSADGTSYARYVLDERKGA